MNWYRNLYVGPRLSKKIEHIKKKLEDHPKNLKIYLLVLPRSSNNQLEIIPAWNFKDENQYIVGIAADKLEAFELVRELAQETYLNNPRSDIRTYLMEKIQK